MSRNTRLRPLQPIFDAEKMRGSIQVGNTPPIPTSIYPFCDFFDRADGPVGPPWEAHPLGFNMLEIVSNQVLVAGGLTTEIAGAMLPPVADINITFGMVISASGSQNAIALAKVDPNGNFISATISGDGNVSMLEFSAIGGLLQMNSCPWVWDNNSHDVELQIGSSTATFLLDSIPICSLAGLTIPNTLGNIRVDLYAEPGATVIMDNFCAVPPP